jgi:DNA-binding MarR family transcriptional regulator
MTQPAMDESAVEELFDAMTGLTRTLRSAAHRWPVETNGIRRTDVVLLRMISIEGECRPGDVAAKLGLAPSVISRQLAALERDGVISRRPDPQDGRAGLVSVTELGRTRLAQIRRDYVAFLRTQLVGWDHDRTTEAVRLLRELTEVLVAQPGSAAPAAPQTDRTTPTAPDTRTTPKDPA